MSSSFMYDVVILGGGPGGYVAAIRAAQLKLSVAVIECGKLGGVCLNVGCIPSKSLIHQAEVFSSAKELAGLGCTVDTAGFDYAKVFAASRKTADALSKGVAYLLKKNGVTVIAGKGTVVTPHEVHVDNGTTVTSKNIIIATGSRPRDLQGFAFNGRTVLSSTDALMLDKLPASLLVLGAGAIGVEFAHIMNRFGVAVHLVEFQERILPLEDRDVSDALRKLLMKRGITILTGTKAVEMSEVGSSVKVILEDAAGSRSEVSVDKVLAVTGRTPNTDAIGLENIGITTDRGFIPVNEFGETAVKGVYAIGDVVATPLLAHVASKEGEIAVEHCAGRTTHGAGTVPGAIYCEPQVASFGLTEQAAELQGLAFVKSVFPYRGAGKSVAIGAPDGFVKLLSEPQTGKLLGAHILGAQATELIHELLLAKTADLPLSVVAGMIHAHPTLSETIMEAARMGGEGAIHV